MNCTDTAIKAMEWEKVPGGSSDEHLHLGNRYLKAGEGPEIRAMWGRLSQGRREFQGGSGRHTRGYGASFKDDHGKGLRRGFCGLVGGRAPCLGVCLLLFLHCPTLEPRALPEPGTCGLAMYMNGHVPSATEVRQPWPRPQWQPHCRNSSSPTLDLLSVLAWFSIWGEAE